MANKTSKARSRDKQVHKVLLGKKIYYLGLGGQRTVCTCGRSQKRGMVSAYNDVYYCSEDCVQKVAKTE